MRVLVLHGLVPPEAPAEDLDTMVQVEAVVRALEESGHEVTTLGCCGDRERTRGALRTHAPAVAFNLVESIEGSTRGIDMVPELLEAGGIRFTGARAPAIRATIDKVHTKAVMTSVGIPTPDWMVPNGDRRTLPAFPGPYIVKSIHEHASLGIADDGVVERGADVPAVLDRWNDRHGRPWFVERFIEGREFAVTLLARPGGVPEVVGIAEMLFDAYPAAKPRIVSYAAKWDHGSFEYHHTTRRFLDPGQEGALAAQLGALAVASWNAFDLRGYGRVDIRIDSDGAPWVLDVNSNPCIAPDSGFIAAAGHAGIPMVEVVRRILANAVGDA